MAPQPLERLVLRVWRHPLRVSSPVACKTSGVHTSRRYALILALVATLLLASGCSSSKHNGSKGTPTTAAKGKGKGKKVSLKEAIATHKRVLAYCNKLATERSKVSMKTAAGAASTANVIRDLVKVSPKAITPQLKFLAVAVRALANTKTTAEFAKRKKALPTPRVKKAYSHVFIFTGLACKKK
ncbi:MAG: hypothetical protein JWM05_582 [Acidimicrobiales bacterium]|nr:hypothetical protein [Acidimicrobiales bacterium]